MLMMNQYSLTAGYSRDIGGGSSIRFNDASHIQETNISRKEMTGIIIIERDLIRESSCEQFRAVLYSQMIEQY